MNFKINPQLILRNLFISILFFNPFLYSEELERAKETPTINYLQKKSKEFYLLGAGDVLKVIISREIPNLTTIAAINGNGEITLPNLKTIFVSGLTLEELSRLLDKKYSEYIKYPDLEVSIVKFRRINFNILGEVARPGFYSIGGSATNNLLTRKNNFESFPTSDEQIFSENNIQRFLQEDISMNIYFPTVFDAIRQAGGINSFSDLENIQIIRKNSITNGGGEITANLNLSKMLEKGDNSENIRIYDGDTIKVKRRTTASSEQISKAIVSNINPRYFKVFVTGKVERPGIQIVSRNASLNDAILLAGGAKFIKGPVQFIRYNPDGTIEKRTFNYRRRSKRGAKNNPILRAGDIISINKNIVNISTEVLSEITKPFLGIYTGKKVLEDLDLL